MTSRENQGYDSDRDIFMSSPNSDTNHSLSLNEAEEGLNLFYISPDSEQSSLTLPETATPEIFQSSPDSPSASQSKCIHSQKELEYYPVSSTNMF